MNDYLTETPAELSEPQRIAIEILFGNEPKFAFLGTDSMFGTWALRIGIEVAMDEAGIRMGDVTTIGNLGNCWVGATVSDRKRGLEILGRFAEAMCITKEQGSAVRVNWFDGREEVWRCHLPGPSVLVGPNQRLEQREAISSTFDQHLASIKL